MAMLRPLDVTAVRHRVASVLASRQSIDAATLYGTCGAIHVRAALGLPQIPMPAIAAWQQDDGTFDDGQTSGPAHALCIAISAMHLSGQPLPGQVAPLAPTGVEALGAWLDGLDWSTTHKDFWGAVTPVLASGIVGEAWTSTLVAWLSERTWCRADDPPWRVISGIYHVASALDAGCVPYPRPQELFDRLMALEWDRAGDEVRRTDCTDGDWAWLLLRLAEMCPGRWEDVMAAIRRVSARRVAQWQADLKSVLDRPTFFIYCALWGTALFQHTCREHFTGPFMRDTLNDPSLFRIR